LPEIEAMITAAALPDRVQRWSLAVFRRLAQAESEVHGVAPDAVHFHEVGGIDAIVDIVGTCIGLDWLDVEAVYCSALPTGGGTVWAAHGRMPVPVPAVLKLWQMRRVPVYDNGIKRELVTPTGAALMVELAAEFGNPPAMTIDRVGWGAGMIDLSLPNALRLWVGDAACPAVDSPSTESVMSSTSSIDSIEAHSLGTLETVAVLETQIDDLSPQVIGYVFDRLFAAGALDVFTTPIGMKKTRTGLALTVICAPDLRTTCETIIFQETTTLGIRHRLQSRTTLAREFATIELDGHTIAIKIARDRQGAIVNIQPEYEDVARAARAMGRSWLEVQRSALQRYEDMAAS
ncbi:MAG: nickel pincer cofactor biosynthesis protein LarC, partial [Oscillatoriales cyanobacterium]